MSSQEEAVNKVSIMAHGGLQTSRMEEKLTDSHAFTYTSREGDVISRECDELPGRIPVFGEETRIAKKASRCFTTRTGETNKNKICYSNTEGKVKENISDIQAKYGKKCVNLVYLTKKYLLIHEDLLYLHNQGHIKQCMFGEKE